MHDQQPAPGSETPQPSRLGRILNVVLTLGIILVLALTGLYTVSPLDLLPDVVPVAGQADDIVALLLGGGSVGLLTILRFLVSVLVGDAKARRSCLIILLVVAVPLVMCLGVGVGLGLVLAGRGG